MSEEIKNRIRYILEDYKAGYYSRNKATDIILRYAKQLYYNNEYRNQSMSQMRQ
jgi:hypothetical protein